MYAACLTPQADPLVVRRAMCGVPRVDALLLAPGSFAAANDWVLSTLRDLRRELFLDPELQVLVDVSPHPGNTVVREVARLLIESHLPSTTIGTINAAPNPQLIASIKLTGDPLLNKYSQKPFPRETIIESVHLNLDAAPIIEAVQSEAKIILATDVAPGALGTAAVFESLRLPPRDWDRLASVVTIARIIENPGPAAPLWMEIDDDGQPFCLGPDTFTAEALQRRLQQERALLETEPECTAVAIDLSSAGVAPTTPGRYQLTGVRGAPPSGRYPVHFSFRMPNSDKVALWPTSVPRSAIEWDVVVKSASEWNV